MIAPGRRACLKYWSSKILTLDRDAAGKGCRLAAPGDAQLNIKSASPQRSVRDRSYDPAEPLVFMHVPKCAGTSVAHVLSHWFGERHVNLRQLPSRDVRNDPRVVGGHSCIRDHFTLHDRTVESAYPSARQFFTMLRDPYDTLLSHYFYGVATQTPKFTKYADLNEFLDEMAARPARASLFNYLLPRSRNEDLHSYADRFVLIGTADRMEQSISHLAEFLGKLPPPIARLNATPRPSSLPERRKEFREILAADFELYEMARNAIDAGSPLGWVGPGTGTGTGRVPRSLLASPLPRRVLKFFRGPSETRRSSD